MYYPWTLTKGLGNAGGRCRVEGDKGENGTTVIAQ